MLGLDFIGMGYQLLNSNTRPWFGLGLFAGGVLDYMVSEAAKLDTRLLPGDNIILKPEYF